MMWQMMVALLHSNGQLGTEGDGDAEKGCQKPAVQQKSTDNALPITEPTQRQSIEGRKHLRRS